MMASETTAQERTCDYCGKPRPSDWVARTVDGKWMCYPCEDLRDEMLWEQSEGGAL